MANVCAYECMQVCACMHACTSVCVEIEGGREDTVMTVGK